jgi:hypothetical protein
VALTTVEEPWGEIPTCISTMADEIRIFSLGFLPVIAEDSYNRLPHAASYVSWSLSKSGSDCLRDAAAREKWW